MKLNRLPTSLELGDGTFQEVMKSSSKPLVVIVSVPATGGDHEFLVNEMKSLATKWRKSDHSVMTRPVVFTWMDQERWAKWMKSMYGVKSSGQVIIADHQV